VRSFTGSDLSDTESVTTLCLSKIPLRSPDLKRSIHIVDFPDFASVSETLVQYVDLFYIFFIILLTKTTVRACLTEPGTTALFSDLVIF